MNKRDSIRYGKCPECKRSDKIEWIDRKQEGIKSWGYQCHFCYHHSVIEMTGDSTNLDTNPCIEHIYRGGDPDILERMKKI